MKLRKKVKLVHGTIALIIIAFVALSTIGVVSFITSSKLNNYYDTISTDSIQKIELYGDFTTTFNALKVPLTKLVYLPITAANVKDAQDSSVKAQGYLSKIEKMDLNDTERAQLKTVQADYNSSLEIFQELVAKKQAGSMITMDKLAKFETNGAEISVVMEKMVNEVKDSTNSDINDYNNVSDTFKIVFWIVVGVSSTLLLLVSILFIHELKYLFEEMIATINTIASGDFTSGVSEEEMEITDGTEFGKMNVQLDIMRKSVASLLNDIKVVAHTVGEESATF